ncbi:MAG: DinB family protein [Phycisphaerales bacterium]|nr:DinB family protein [Phycisphaerales bacterium]MCB9836110.1 DinB family protein [Phycisphaera sp.]
MSGCERAAALADAMRATKPFVTRFLAGFDDSNRTKQMPTLPNHAVWCMGHLALTMNRFAMRFDGKPLPESDYVTGDGGAGNANQFDTESVCVGSKPVDDPSKYPTLERGRRVFEDAIDRIGDALESMSEAQLGEEQPWGKGQFKVSDLAARIMFHNGMHAGQLADLRRAMGLPGVIG